MPSKNQSPLTVSVVINTNYGGFALSQQAAEAVLQRKGIGYRLEKATHDNSEYPYIGNGWDTAMNVCTRCDADLVAVVREMGTKAAGAPGCALKIVDFAIDIDISNYDGIETAKVYGTEVA
jgi:hypothetical protein